MPCGRSSKEGRIPKPAEFGPCPPRNALQHTGGRTSHTILAPGRTSDSAPAREEILAPPPLCPRRPSKKPWPARYGPPQARGPARPHVERLPSPSALLLRDARTRSNPGWYTHRRLQPTLARIQDRGQPLARSTRGRAELPGLCEEKG